MDAVLEYCKKRIRTRVGHDLYPKSKDKIENKRKRFELST